MKVFVSASWLSVIASSLLFTTAAHSAEYFVSPAGRSDGDGSQSRPLDLASALAGKLAQPGDTYWLRGGTYTGVYYPSLQGQPGKPITVRQYPGERAILDGTIYQDGGGYVTYWGFEVTCTASQRTSSQATPWPTDLTVRDGISVRSQGIKLINLVVHDVLGNGLSLWSEGPDTEVSGCIIYHNGWQAPDRGHGHGIYTQNTTGTKLIRGNLMFGGYCNGIQLYGTSAARLNNYTITGNTIVNSAQASTDGVGNNITIYGGTPIVNLTVDGNLTYNSFKTSGTVQIGGSGVANQDVRIRNNYFMEFARIADWATAEVSGNTGAALATVLELDQTVNSLSVLKPGWDRNTYYSTESPWQPFCLYTSTANGYNFTGWKTASGLDANSTYVKGRPTGQKVMVQPNPYETGRGLVTVFNWDKLSQVSVDVSSILPSGTQFEVRNGLNFFTSPVLTGTYNGQALTLPMTGLTTATPYGKAALASSAPEFAAFVILPVGQVSVQTVKTQPTVTWSTPASITYGTALSSSQLNAAANVAGSFAYAPAAGSVLAAGTSQTLTAVFTPADATKYYGATNTVTLAVNKASLTITADNKSKVAGDANPVLTASYSGFVNGDTTSCIDTPATLATSATASSPAGTYPITVGGAVDNNYTISMVNGTLTVTAAPTVTLSSLTVSPASKSLTTGQTQQLALTGNYSNGSTSNLTTVASWSSSSASVATVSSGLVSAVGAGSATVTATYGGLSTTAAITVTAVAPTLSSLAVNPASKSLTTGQTQQLALTGNYSNGSTSNLTTVASWSSSSASVATVSSGLVSAVGAGSATVTATYGGLSTTAAITVTAPANVSSLNVSNVNAITIRDNATASTYPSAINVNGMSGNLSKVTVTLNQLTHSWPYDVGMLLVAPTGQKVALMQRVAWAGGVKSVTITLDDDASQSLPNGTSFTNGTYKPTSYSTMSFVSPAPATPYSTTLSDLKGISPNGTWSLYIVDVEAPDSGAIAGGWSLNLTTTNAVVASSDLAVTCARVSSSYTNGQNVTFQIQAGNNGPSSASGVVLTDVLPTGATLMSATLSQGAYSYANGTVTCNLGTLATGVVATASITARLGSVGTQTNNVAITSSNTDATVQNNSAQQIFTVLPAGGLANTGRITIPDSGVANPYPATINVANIAGQIYKVTVTLSNLTHAWPYDMGVMLVGPTGQKVVLMSGAGWSGPVANVNVTFDDYASKSLPKGSSFASGSYKPTVYGQAKTFPAPAPSGSYSQKLSAFNNTSPNGAWSLYVVDTESGVSGEIAGGWSLTVSTTDGASAKLASDGSVVSIPQESIPTTEPIAITGLQPLEKGAIRLTYASEVGGAYAIEASQDNANWTTLGVMIATSANAEFLDTQAGSCAMRFYRVARVNPANN